VGTKRWFGLWVSELHKEGAIISRLSKYQEKKKKRTLGGPDKKGSPNVRGVLGKTGEKRKQTSQVGGKVCIMGGVGGTGTKGGRVVGLF